MQHQASLLDITAAPGFTLEAARVVEQVAQVAQEEDACSLLREASAVFGADAAAFASFIRDDDSFESYRFLLACDPRWCDEYLEEAWFAADPWLKHAMEHGTPARASEIATETCAQRSVVALAQRYGFRSAAVIPAPSAGSMSRLGVLCLGSERSGFFEGEGFAKLRIVARSLAMELHEWWVERIQQQLIDDNDLTTDDLRLLRYEWQGLRTKEIARLLQATPQSVNSRFQRLLAKMGVQSRRAAARRAAEYGVIQGS
jgi:DNA-binding CsgD family transcriptional regulator